MSEGHIKISDFGLAHQLAKTIETASTSNLDKMPVRWLAPEAMRGDTSLSSDVYSFGVLMWEIYTDAEIPFKDKTLAQVFDGVQRKGLKLEPPEVMPNKVAALMKSCTTYDPNRRPNMKKVRYHCSLYVYGFFRCNISWISNWTSSSNPKNMPDRIETRRRSRTTASQRSPETARNSTRRA